MVPSDERNFVGFGDFLTVGFGYLGVFRELCGLEPHESVLDIGCGIGRMAVPLTQYLGPRGRYEGFDVVPEGIAWCRERIGPRYPNFRFQRVDLRNGHYNPKGAQLPSAFRFPYDDSSFDFVFLTSVFTHMLPADVAQYLREMRRVMRSGGRALATFFLLDEESRSGVAAGRADIAPSQTLGRYGVRSGESPESAVFYDEDYVLEMLEEAGFGRPGRIARGSWSGRDEYYDYQDVVVFAPR